MLLLLTLIPLMCTGDSPLSNATTTVTTNYRHKYRDCHRECKCCDHLITSPTNTTTT